MGTSIESSKFMFKNGFFQIIKFDLKNIHKIIFVLPLWKVGCEKSKEKLPQLRCIKTKF